ncbi:MAG: hypothetical protein WBM14_17710 [Terracidiphilus sp.]
MMKFGTMLYRFGTLAALALVLSMSARIVRAQSMDSEEISNLLAQAKSHAVLAEDDSATLESFTRSKLSWESFARKITVIRDHVNELGKLHGQLLELRPQGSPCQQRAIDQIDPLVREMADHLTAAINHLNDNQSKVHMPPFRDYVNANYELASRTAALIRDFVAYDEASSKADSLEQQLELPSDK